MNICLIPARGGSKRIPQKNIRDFCGKPMIAHSIEAAKKSEIFDRIIVSTDSDKIAGVADEWGAEVPFIRPSNLADDNATTDEVIMHALQWLENEEEMAGNLCCLYATAPFARAEYLIKGYEKLCLLDATTAVSVTTFSFPIFRGLKVNKDDRLEMLWPEHRLTRSQDLVEAYHDAGQFYWLNVRKYMNVRRLYSEDAIPVIIPRYLVQDIDSEEDWACAELMHETLQRRKDSE